LAQRTGGVRSPLRRVKAPLAVLPQAVRACGGPVNTCMDTAQAQVWLSRLGLHVKGVQSWQ